MRVLIAAFGTRGDVHPLVALAQVLRARGHQVTVCAPPDDEGWIRARGLTCHAVGPAMKSFVALITSGRGLIRAMLQVYPRMISEQYRAFEPFAADCDVMLGGSLTTAGPTFEERFGLRYHYVSFAPCIIPSSEHPSLNVPSQRLPRWLNRLSWWMSSAANDLILRTTVNAERRRLGLGPIQDTWRHMLHRRLIIGSEPALAPLCQEAPRDTVQTGAWFAPETESLPEEVEAFLSAGPAPVFIGFGSMPDAAPARTARRLVEAIRLAGVRALVPARPGIDQTMLPSTVLAIGPSPHGKLFPRCAAVVHHGGAGTTATAARAGVPQVLVPHMTDQHFWRHRLQTLGLAATEPARLSNPASLANAIRRCLDDGALRERARSFPQRMTQDGLDHAVRVVEAG